jgi:phosphoribosylamine--glycine ligase
MGAFAPSPHATPELVDRIARTVIEPALAGMRGEGCPFTGCLYAGLMITETGPVVVEFNGRFGDPETQVQLPLVTSDLAALLAAAARGEVTDAPLVTAGGTSALTVALAAAGYPGSSDAGALIEGLGTATGNVKVFHAGTRLADGAVVTTGGRTLNITGWNSSLAGARAEAYSAIGESGVHFGGMQYRTDIGAGV